MTHDTDTISRDAAMRAAREAALDKIRAAVCCHGEMTMAEVTSDADDVADAIAALPAAPVSVRVKPLVWEQLGTSYRAPAPLFGNIRVENYSKHWSVHWSAPGITDLFTVGSFDTPEAAKAAAQADYAARILAALDVQPAPDVAEPAPKEHYDDYAVRQFAKLMAEKMATSRAKGRSGWNDPEKCSVDYLRFLLYEHLDKGDPVDVANICMMLRHYDASTYRDHCNCKPPPDVTQIRAKVAQAIFDPGATEGYKGDRSLTDWQVDAVMRALIDTPPPPDAMAGKVAALVEAAEKVTERFLPVRADLIFSKRTAIDGLAEALAAMKGDAT